MPRFDKTGPVRQGSKTGRGFGKCNPDTSSNDQQFDVDMKSPGRGLRFSFGRRNGKGQGLGRNRS